MNTPLGKVLRTSGAAATAALLVAAGLTGSAAAAATAPSVGSVSVDDSRTDMVGHGADIFRVRLVHGDRVRVVVKHRNLVRSSRPGGSAVVYADTRRGVPGPDYALVTGLWAGTDYSLHRADGWRIKYRRVVDRPHNVRLSFATDRTIVDFAHRTLGRPGRVRVAVHTAGNDSVGREVHDWLRGPNRFTPWVTRG